MAWRELDGSERPEHHEQDLWIPDEVWPLLWAAGLARKDWWEVNPNVSPEVHPVLIGFTYIVDTQNETFQVVPVWTTDNGTFAERFNPKEYSVTSWAVDLNKVLRYEHAI